ncbi:MAG: O-antigen ligase family protein [Verrucomicrobiota bacterium]
MKSRDWKKKRMDDLEADSPETPAELTWKEKFLAIIHSDPLINSVVAVAITVGFFHGWLKIRFQHPATTFFFDALLSVALVLVFMQLRRGVPLIPRGAVGQALKVYYGVCAIYAFLPWGPPFIVSLASLRGWCFATLMFAVGYHLTKSLNQAKGYFYVLIVLGLITTGYGLQQSPEEVEKRISEDEQYAERYGTSYYLTETGKQLRIFSTFVSSGAFGGTLAYVTIFCVALLTDPKATKRERNLLLLAALPMIYAIVRSGSRSALLSLFFGFIVVAWYRRNLMNFIVVPALIFVALVIGSKVTGGSALERFGSVLDPQAVIARNLIPTRIGWEYMTDENLLGGGLGKSGYGVPSFISARAGYPMSEYKFSDGDLGRLMIEMGLVGMIIFGRILYIAAINVKKTLDQLKDTPVATVALASAGCIVIAIASFPSGSPFLGIPMGALVWFFLGTLQKLLDDSANWTDVDASAGEAKSVPQKVFLHRRASKRNRPSASRPDPA